MGPRFGPEDAVSQPDRDAARGVCLERELHEHRRVVKPIAKGLLRGFALQDVRRRVVEYLPARSNTVHARTVGRLCIEADDDRRRLDREEDLNNRGRVKTLVEEARDGRIRHGIESDTVERDRHRLTRCALLTPRVVADDFIVRVGFGVLTPHSILDSVAELATKVVGSSPVTRRERREAAACDRHKGAAGRLANARTDRDDTRRLIDLKRECIRAEAARGTVVERDAHALGAGILEGG